MGLDSHLFRRAKTITGKMLTELECKKQNEEIAYWRKSYKINEMFLNYARNSNGDDLNTKEIPLTKEDLKEILEWIKEMLKADEFEDTYEESDFRKTKIILTKVIKETDFDNQEIYFWAWW